MSTTFNHRTQPLVTKLLHWLMLPLLALVSTASLADTLRFERDGLTTSALGGGQDFLPVEQAYQLHPEVVNGELVMSWLIAPGYYLYRDSFSTAAVDPDGSQQPLEQHFQGGVTRYDEYFEKEVEVYYTATEVRASLPATAAAGVVRVQSQGCADAGLCYPPRTQYVTISGSALAVSDSPPGDIAPSSPGGSESLALILVFALLGGLILNLMPCVFPVLSIKVLSLSQGHLSVHRRHVHGLAYSAGVVTSFIAVALVLIALRAGGQALGWGFQLQSPGFITALVFLFFVMGLGFMGFYTAGLRLMNLGSGATGGTGLRHSFLTGVLATIIASPCSAPFMGTALGFALTQPTPVAVVVFAALGLGMALPFLVLTWVPGVLEALPKPGPWMEKLKELLAFPLFLTCVWLLWILGHQTDADTLVAVLTGLVLVTLAIWLGKGRTAAGKVVAAVTLVAAIAIPARQLTLAQEEQLWEPYSQARLNSLLAEGRGVFVNLTADWCITCLANEKMALASDEFAATLKGADIVYLKGDWTNYDPEITALLNANGRNGVPLYLLYRAGQRQPEILPQILTRTSVISALTKK